MPPPRKHLPKAPATPEAPPVANSTEDPAVVLGATTPGQGATPRTLVDEGANPAGPPEGTDHGHAGDGPEVAEAAVSATAPLDRRDALAQPTAQQPDWVPQERVGSPTGRLILYLAEHYPAEVSRPTPEGPEHPADTAVRLLARLGARGTAQVRCSEAYCNLPTGHTAAHGWVHQG